MTKKTLKIGLFGYNKYAPPGAAYTQPCGEITIIVEHDQIEHVLDLLNMALEVHEWRILQAGPSD